MKFIISYSSVNDGQWGSDTSDDGARLIAENVTALAIAFIEHHWPKAWAEARVHDAPQPDAVRCYDHPDAEELAMEVERYISDHWFEETVWALAFDAAAYVKRRPR